MRIRLAVLTLAAIASAAVRPAFAQPLPALSGPVTDLAGVIDARAAAELDRRVRSLEAATGDAVVVVTVPAVAPYSTIEEYAVRLFEHAGIGGRDRDNGVLVLLAVEDRAVRIEVGYGLEEHLTDGASGDIIRQSMLPAFREGRYGDGLLAGTTQIVHRLAAAQGVTLADVPDPSEARTPPLPPMALIIALIVLLLVVSAIGRHGRDGRPFRGRRGGTWSGWHGGVGGFGGGSFGGGFGRRGGGGFGGFGGFGGGLSGGGGASGRW